MITITGSKQQGQLDSGRQPLTLEYQRGEYNLIHYSGIYMRIGEDCDGWLRLQCTVRGWEVGATMKVSYKNELSPSKTQMTL